MRLLAACMAGFLAAGIAFPATAQDDLASLSDEFNGNSLNGWTWFHDAYGWPNKVKTVDVGVTTPGTLHIEPYHSGWIYDLNAPFLFREVHGDFDVRARVRVRGAEKAIAGGTWSLGGLMARVPNKLDSKTWVPRSENWHFITTGVGYVAGQQMTEAKSTFNSYSSLKLRPFPSGWVELRMVRVGVSIIVMARPEGETAWQVRDRFYRMESNPVMQVGLNAYTISDNVPIGADNPDVVNRTVNRDAPVDMILEVDWIRFSRPQVQVPADWYTQVSANPLADPSLPEADLLAMLGN